MARRREVSDAQIARVARKVFLEQGVHVPVSVVAKELGVSPATLFVRMGTKARLISAALWPSDPAVLLELESGSFEDGPLDEQLIRIALKIARFVDEVIPATFTLYAAGLRPKATDDFSDATPRRLRRALSRWLRDAVHAGRVDCDPRMVTETLIGTIEARAMHAFLGKRTFTERETRTFARSLIATVLGSR